MDHQIQDIEHKLTTRAINTLHARGVRTLVVGDVRDIRVGYDKGAVQNQRLHQARSARHGTTSATRLGSVAGSCRLPRTRPTLARSAPSVVHARSHGAASIGALPVALRPIVMSWDR
jgi:hypothetical protein